MSASLVILWLIAIYLTFVEPILGQRMYGKLQAGSISRIAFYRIRAIWEWSFALLVIIVFLASRIPLRLLGLYNPNGFVLSPGEIGGLIMGISTGMVVVIGINIVASIWRNRAIARGHHAGFFQSRPKVRQMHFDAMLPQTSKERWTFVGVAVTAGICEEILYRGMLVYLLNDKLQHFGPILTLFATAIIFALAHLYQGWKGMLQTGVLGFVFTGIYLSTGALWIPIFLHLLIDLRFLFALPEANRVT